MKIIVADSFKKKYKKILFLVNIEKLSEKIIIIWLVWNILI